jgi:hypothetical protein
MCWAAMALSGLTAAPVFGSTVLQCVPYARIVSGVELRGDALTWWDQAKDQYKRGSKPKKGAVLAFKPNGPMALGHVAVVSKILDDRHILIRHANWSVPGSIEEDVLAIDASDEGDWSQVRVWFSPYGQMGARTNPTYGFIYPAKAKLHPFNPDPALGESVRLASQAPDDWRAVETPALPPVRRTMLAMASYSRNSSPPSEQKHFAPTRKVARQANDPFIVEYADGAGDMPRSLGDIIADVKRDAALN